MVVFWLGLVSLGVMLFFPESGAAKVLRRWLVEKPAGLLDGLTFKRFVIGLVFVPLLLLIAMSMPELLIFMTSLGDAAMLLEISAALFVAGQASSLRGIWRRMKQLAGGVAWLGGALNRRMVRGSRERRRRGDRPAKPPRADDPEPGLGLAWA